MRSRDVRPFTVEFKSKRRPAAALPPSIWGDTAKHFKTAPDRGVEHPLRSQPVLDLASSSAHARAMQEVQPKRILPDLRLAEVNLDAEIIAVRVKRTARKKEGTTMLHDADKRDEHQTEPASVAPDPFMTSGPVSRIELPPALDSAQGGESSPQQETGAGIEVPQAAAAAPSGTAILVPGKTKQRGRKWMRRAHELPRGERWKRRLPEVCR